MSSRLWDQLLGEPYTAFSAFKSYLDSPSPRMSPERFAIVHGLRPAECLQMAKTFYWERRAVSFDTHWDKVRERHRENAIKETVEDIEREHREIMRVARAALRTEMVKTLHEIQNSPRTVFRPGQVIQLAKVIFDMDRLVSGKATQIIQSGIDFAAMSDDDFEKLAEIEERNRTH